MSALSEALAAYGRIRANPAPDTEETTVTEQPDPITEPCDCNQPGAVHQRGDEGFCRASSGGDLLSWALSVVRGSLDPDQTLVLVGSDIEITSQVRYPTGTFQVTTKLKEGR